MPDVRTGKLFLHASFDLLRTSESSGHPGPAIEGGEPQFVLSICARCSVEETPLRQSVTFDVEEFFLFLDDDKLRLDQEKSSRLWGCSKRFWLAGDRHTDERGS
jgi:hypothetical protein